MTDTPAPFRLDAQSRRIFTGLLMGMLVASVSQTIVGPAMPRIVAELGGMEHYSWVATAAMLVSAISVPIVGKLSDLFGRRPFYLGGLAIFVTGSILAGTAQTFWWLVAARAVQGLGMGIIMPLSQTIVGDIIPPRQRGKYQGYMGVVFGVTSVAGPLLGGLITDALGWRWLFYVAVPVGLIALFVIARFLVMDHKPREAVIDYWGIATMSVGITATLLAVSLGGTSYPWASPLILSLLIGGLAVLVVFVLIELRAPEPVLPLRLFRSGIFTFANLGAFGMSMVMFGSIIYVPIYAQGVLAVNASTSGLITLPLMLGLVLVGMGAGLLITRTGRYKEIMLVGAVLLALGVVVLSRLGKESSVWEVVAGVGLIGIGLGALSQQYTLVVQNAVPRKDLGVATAALQFFRNVGATIGTALFGSVLSAGLDAAIFANLPPELANTMPHDTINAGSVLDPTVIGSLPVEVVAAVRAGLAQQIAGIFVFCLPIVAFVFVCTLLIKPMELRDTVNSAEDAGRELLDTMAQQSGDIAPVLSGSGTGERTRERLLGLQLAVVADSAARPNRPLLRQAVAELGAGDFERGLMLLHCTAEMLTSEDADVAAATEKFAGALADRVSHSGDTMSDSLRRRIAIAAAEAPRQVVLDEIEQTVAERYEAVDIGKLRTAANDLTAALLVDVAADRRS
ncbi:MDR family MFS transporter [Micropruina sonneratiae]|uniref:MDR family MFS transporter n=1 Tax=Micropruina sonneratiae TaxID=2986940 RepID=UPI0022278154|nr:MDR family MFS transporter [Micropruina sp. KQZ13P-5]MCW3158206.1 MFS transporter [Micropruina sp. KQZ13P-5]